MTTDMLYCCPDGLAYAVGTLGGVLHVGSMEIKQHAVQSLGQPVRAVAFSPSRNLLAAASGSVVTVFQFGPTGYDEPSKVSCSNINLQEKLGLAVQGSIVGC